MRLCRLKLADFRNYVRCEIPMADGVTILQGENAQGKTNLLEGILLLTGVKSWRTVRKNELVRLGSPFSRIEGDVESRGRPFSLRMTIPVTGRTSCEINGIQAKRQYQLSEVLRCVLFSPEDLGLVRDGAASRRRFLDDALCQLRPRYAQCLSDYQRLLDGKSRLLRSREENPSFLSVLPEYNSELVRLGAALIGYRAKFLRELTPICSLIHEEISGGREQLALRYATVSTVTDPFAPQAAVAEELYLHMQQHQGAELAAGSCLSGPHKDDIELSIDGRPARSFASQGQTRTAALALKFSQRELFFRDNGEYPLLLLDDVLSELDMKRRDFVKNHALGGQSIITCCEEENSFGGTAAKLFHVKNGVVASMGRN